LESARDDRVGESELYCKTLGGDEDDEGRGCQLTGDCAKLLVPAHRRHTIHALLRYKPIYTIVYYHGVKPTSPTKLVRKVQHDMI
jgi:hypothetical protein